MCWPRGAPRPRGPHAMAQMAQWLIRPWFPGYWDWLWYPGLTPVVVSIAFSFHISSSRSSLEPKKWCRFVVDLSYLIHRVWLVLTGCGWFWLVLTGFEFVGHQSQTSQLKIKDTWSSLTYLLIYQTLRYSSSDAALENEVNVYSVTWTISIHVGFSL